METAAASLGELARQYSPAQRRTIAAALALFVERGVGDTSLQMIANAVGVTKAAIYHQFRTKEAIVLAVAEVELVALEEAVDNALAGGVGPEVRRELLARVIAIAVARRKAVGTLLSDPVLLRYLNEQDLYRRLMSRVRAVLFGYEDTDRSRVSSCGPRGGIRCGRQPIARRPGCGDAPARALRGHAASLARQRGWRSLTSQWCVRGVRRSSLGRVPMEAGPRRALQARRRRQLACRAGRLVAVVEPPLRHKL